MSVEQEAAAFLLETEFGTPAAPTAPAAKRPDVTGNARIPSRSRDEATLAGRISANEGLLATVWNDVPVPQDGADALMNDSSTFDRALELVKGGRPSVRRPQPMNPKRAEPQQAKPRLDDLTPEQLEKVQEKLQAQLEKVQERMWGVNAEAYEEAVEDDEEIVDPYAARQEGWNEGYAAAEASLREEFEQQVQQAALQTEWLIDDEADEVEA